MNITFNMFSKYDKNNDGQLDDSEIGAVDSRFQSFVKGGDSDKDGKVSKKELNAACAKFRRGRSGGGSRGGGGH